MTSCKLEDIPYMLSELCRFFDADALQKLVRLAAKIETDDNLKKNYLKMLQQKYLRELPSILNSSYPKQSLEELHNAVFPQRICQQLFGTENQQNSEPAPKRKTTLMLEKIKRLKSQ